MPGEASTVRAFTDGPPEKKIRRPPLACEQCRRLKIRCDRKSPCDHCTKAKIQGCYYAPKHTPLSKQQRSARRNSRRRVPTLAEATPRNIDRSGPNEPDSSRPSYGLITASSASYSVPSSVAGSTSDAANVDLLLARVHELEEKLNYAVQLGNGSGGEPLQPGDEGAVFVKGSEAKTRYFGESNWMNIADLLPTEVALFARDGKEKGELSQTLTKCKALARTMKESRLKPLISNKLGQDIPERALCDVLVDTYLRLFEGVFRIVHIPTFQVEYERFWLDRRTVGEAFVIQLQLCMALGATLHDDNYSLRPQAAQWVYEAHLWLILPPEKRRMSLAGMQVMCLLVLAKSVCSVGQDVAWTTTGSLVRQAMYMGLHRDPKHFRQMTAYTVEMRRRIWATVLELNLQSSFDSGGSPLLSGMDYDTQPPANLDDEQIHDTEDTETPKEHPKDVLTKTSVQIALLKSLPLRVALIKHVNEFRASDSYEETLRLNSQVTKACRAFSTSVASLLKKSKRATRCDITDFHIDVAELFLYRCFHALHQPVLLRHLNDPKYYFSRKMHLEAAIQILHKLDLSGPPRTSASVADFTRLSTNASGMFRNIPMHALMAIAVELAHRGSEQGISLGYLPSIGEADMRTTLARGSAWTKQRVVSGETNVKGYCFYTSCLAHIDAIEAGDGVEEAILRAARGSAVECWEALRDMALRAGLPVDGVQEEEGMMDVEGFPHTWVDWVGDFVWDDFSEVL